MVGQERLDQSTQIAIADRSIDIREQLQAMDNEEKTLLQQQIALTDGLFRQIAIIVGLGYASRSYSSGTASCKKIVERHGGRIWAESEPGIGTVFYLTLNAN
ncbi:hypothetical protein A4S05_27885 [Nostoc sp. KVJ20]|uniref:ATP-binding protein n=1 Tax=Nostoc sp. KVJ20 TaxID=457944 RepID=UPI00083DD650|nr:ATP-binding protein [Nostoc sp. KVJ20]ODH01673.1 hypothetical protein A4S05_27885 [Nostoc sp. KVJ20]